MKNSRIIILIFTAAVLSGSCAKNRESELRPDRPIAIQTLIMGTHSKATVVDGITTKALLDDIHLLYHIDSPEFANTVPITCSRSITGNIVFPIGNNMWYDKTTDQQVLFMAYWPTTGALGAEVTSTEIKWAIDGKTDILMSRPWSAGTYSSPAKEVMKIDHQLVQLEVICRAEGGASTEIINMMWGKLLGVNILATLPTATFVYNTDFVSDPTVAMVTYSGQPIDRALLKSDYETPFSPIYIPNYLSTDPLVAMIAPSKGAFELRVVTEGQSTLPENNIVRIIKVQLKDANGVNTDLEIGNKYSIVINFKAMSRDISIGNISITPWSDAYVGTVDEIV